MHVLYSVMYIATIRHVFVSGVKQDATFISHTNLQITSHWSGIEQFLEIDKRSVFSNPCLFVVVTPRIDRHRVVVVFKVTMGTQSLASYSVSRRLLEGMDVKKIICKERERQLSSDKSRRARQNLNKSNHSLEEKCIETRQQLECYLVCFASSLLLQ